MNRIRCEPTDSVTFGFCLLLTKTYRQFNEEAVIPSASGAETIGKLIAASITTKQTKPKKQVKCVRNGNQG